MIARIYERVRNLINLALLMRLSAAIRFFAFLCIFGARKSHGFGVFKYVEALNGAISSVPLDSVSSKISLSKLALLTLFLRKRKQNLTQYNNLRLLYSNLQTVIKKTMDRE